MKRKMMYIALMVLIASLIITIPKLILSMKPIDHMNKPDITIGENVKSIVDRVGPVTARLSQISVWHHKKWTLVCGFDRNGQLQDYHLIDNHGRCIESTVGKENTVWHILNEIRNHSISEMEKVYDTTSGDEQYGKIGYDGGIVIWDNGSNGNREVFDYTDINGEQPYVFKHILSFYVERLIRFW